MKKIHLFILLLIACVMVQAQESLFLRKPSKANKLIQLDVDWGGNFDLAYRGKGNMLTSLSDKGTVFPAVSFRMQYFFSRKWGGYGSVRIDIPKKYKRNYYAALVHAAEADFYVSNLTREEQEPQNGFCIDAGVVYRIENSHWAFYPRFGMGASNVEYQSVHAELKKKGGNELYTIRYYEEEDYGDLSKDIFVLSAGFTVNYKLSRYCYLLFNANYTQPIGVSKCEEYVTNLYTKESVSTNVYKSSTLARNLNVSIGFGIPIYLGKKTHIKPASWRVE